MAGEDANRYLSQISTRWSLLKQAHSGTPDEERRARQALLQRYGGAVYRYLLGALHDAAAADDLFQEFALLFLTGQFRGANPACGRFRDYLKTALFRLIVRHYRRKQSGVRELEDDVVDPAPAGSDAADRDFVRSWRGELLARAWQALARFEEETGRPFYRVLRHRVEEPDLTSEQRAACLSAQLGKRLTAAGIRQTLHRARETFAAFLLDEVAQSLAAPGPEEIAQELADLDLLEYCRPALARYRDTPSPG